MTTRHGFFPMKYATVDSSLQRDMNLIKSNNFYQKWTKDSFLGRIFDVATSIKRQENFLSTRKGTKREMLVESEVW